MTVRAKSIGAPPGGAALARLLALALLLALPTAVSAATSNTTEKLLAFKASFVNGEQVLSSWVAGSDPCAGTWKGIVCVDSAVTQMMLGRSGLRGTIPPAGFPLPEGLLLLDLEACNVSSTIPPAMQLPSSLLSLAMDGNQLSGAIPPLTLPAGIMALTMDRNRLTTLPAAWDLPSNFAYLSLQGNQLSGSLPTGIALPSGMQQLLLNGNNFSGSIPATWALPARFELLQLHENALTGTLPSWAGMSSLNVTVTPGNPGLCGEVPTYPHYEDRDLFPLTNSSLPACSSPQSAPASDSGGGSNTGAIVGGVVGGVCGIALVGALGWWFLRQRRGPQGHPDSEKGLSGVENGGKGNMPQDEKGGPKGESASDPSFGASTADQIVTPTGSEGMRDSRGKLLASDALLSSIVTRLGEGSGAKSSDQAAGTKKSAMQSSLDGASSAGMDTWRVPFESLHLIKLIGRGSFGRVYLATYHESQVAVKLLLGPEAAAEPDMNAAADLVLSASNPILQNLKQEASMMAGLRHPNILAFIGWCEEPPCLVTEHCPRGSLFDALKKARSSPEATKQLTWVVRLKMALETAKGMYHLHTRTPAVVHRDLKSANLLVGPNYQIKVSDFNLSKLLGEASVLSSMSVVNPRWLAPEVLQGATHTFASDVYSFGVVLWELLSLQQPFEDNSNFWQVTQLIMDGKRPPIPSPEEVPGGAFDDLDAYTKLITRCWAVNPEERPSFSEIVPELRRLLTAVIGDASPHSGLASKEDSGSTSPEHSGGNPGQPLKTVRIPNWSDK